MLSLLNGPAQRNVGDERLAGQLRAIHGARVAALEPALDGSSLVSLSVSRRYGVPHDLVRDLTQKIGQRPASDGLHLTIMILDVKSAPFRKSASNNFHRLSCSFVVTSCFQLTASASGPAASERNEPVGINIFLESLLGTFEPDVVRLTSPGPASGFDAKDGVVLLVELGWLPSSS